jgi:general secretion pathway protein L
MASSTSTNYPVQFWRWWLSEIKSLAPLADKRKFANRQTRREIVINSGNVSLHEKQKLEAPLHTPVLHVLESNFTEILLQAKRVRQVIVTFGNSEYFARTSILPAQAMPRAEKILDLELRQVLPLAKSDIFTSWVETGSHKNGQVTLLQVAIKRTRVEEIVAALREAGVKITAICFRDGLGNALPIVMDARGETLGANVNRLWQKIAAAIFTLAFALSATFIWLAFDWQSTNMTTVAAANDQMRTKALKVRQSIESAQKEDVRIAQLINFRSNAPNLVAVWDNLAHILPDTAWVSTFALNGKTFNIDGEAADAEGLVKLLETSQYFKNVKFTAPVTKNPGADRSHYAIAMEFEGPQQ